jgi:hypothetical protein
MGSLVRNCVRRAHRGDIHMIAPNEPSGSNSLANWLKKLLRYSKANEIKPGLGYRVKRTTGGTVLEISGTGGVPNAAVIMPFSVSGTFDDYITGNIWVKSLDAFGTLDYVIAKPWKLRFTENTAYGDVDYGSYVYGGDNSPTQTRVASYDAGTVYTQTHEIIPRYAIGDVIWCAKCETKLTHSGEDVEWIDLNIDGRTWAKSADTE